MTITVTKTFATEAEAAAWLSGSTAAAPTAEKSTEKSTTSTGKTSTGKTSTGKTSTSKPANEHTKEEMVAALTELRDAKGKDVARRVISEHGGVEKMADIPDDKIDAVYAAAKAAMEDGDDGM